jgi:hypothetical protein
VRVRIVVSDGRQFDNLIHSNPDRGLPPSDSSIFGRGFSAHLESIMATKQAKLSYSQKLKDPRWQKMRLQILERDQWTCQSCRAKDKTLHVHHGYYKRGLEPWEYVPSTLQTLCEDCHERADESRERSMYYLAHLSLNDADVVQQLLLEIATSDTVDSRWEIIEKLDSFTTSLSLESDANATQDAEHIKSEWRIERKLNTHCSEWVLVQFDGVPTVAIDNPGSLKQAVQAALYLFGQGNVRIACCSTEAYYPTNVVTSLNNVK